jgi:hypothetical protein
LKIVRKTSPAGLVIFVAFAVGAATIGSPTPALPGGTPPTPATLQLIQFRGLVTVPIRIGASQALNFVIDSGSEDTTLNDAGLVEELNLHTRQGGVGRGMGGARLPIHIAPDLAIRAGDFELFRTDLAIHHLDSLLDNDAGPRLHGLLGSALFERYVVDINPALGTVSCHDPETFSYDGPGHVVPLIMDHRRAFVRAKVTTVKRSAGSKSDHSPAVARRLRSSTRPACPQPRASRTSTASSATAYSVSFGPFSTITARF